MRRSMGHLAPASLLSLRRTTSGPILRLDAGVSDHPIWAMTRHRAIIKRLGGYVALADQLGLDAETVKSWNKQDRAASRRCYRVDVAKMARLSPEYPPAHQPEALPRGAP